MIDWLQTGFRAAEEEDAMCSRRVEKMVMVRGVPLVIVGRAHYFGDAVDMIELQAAYVDTDDWTGHEVPEAELMRRLGERNCETLRFLLKQEAERLGPPEYRSVA